MRGSGQRSCHPKKDSYSSVSNIIVTLCEQQYTHAICSVATYMSVHAVLISHIRERLALCCLCALCCFVFVLPVSCLVYCAFVFAIVCPLLPCWCFCLSCVSFFSRCFLLLFCFVLLTLVCSCAAPFFFVFLLCVPFCPLVCPVFAPCFAFSSSLSFLPSLQSFEDG